MPNNIEFGSLGIPLEPVCNSNTEIRRLSFTIPHEIRKSFLHTEEGKRIKKKLIEEFSIPKNQVIRYGQNIGGYLKFDDIYNWYVYYANLNTENKADIALKKYLESDSFEGILCLWISGVQISKTEDIGDNFKIVPILDMPVSTDRERYRLEPPEFLYLQPECAITTKVQLNKNHQIDNNQVFNPQYEKLLEISRIISLVCDSSCSPTLQSFYPIDCPVSFLGGGGQVYPLTPNIENPTLLETDLIKELIRLQNNTQEKLPEIRTLINRSLHWYNKAKTESDIADKFLSLSVALEMLLLQKYTKPSVSSQSKKLNIILRISNFFIQKNEKPKLSKSFIENGSNWIGYDENSKKTTKDKLTDIYKIRSSVAHRGKMTFKRSGKSGKKYKYARYCENRQKSWETLFPDYLKLAETIIKKTIQEEFPPNWKNL